MSTKPELGVKSFNIDGFMHNGAPVDMRASAWLNVPKGMDQDPAALQALNQVRQLMMDHGISVRIQLQHRAGEDPKTWPRIASFPLFPNRPQQQQGFQQQGYQAPAPSYQQAPASAQVLNDEIPF